MGEDIRESQSTNKVARPFKHRVKPVGSVLGFDTETLKSGYAFLLADGEGNYAWIRELEDLFPFILSGKRYVCYNLDFDAQAMLKWFGRDFCKELLGAEEGKASYNNVRVQYIPHKFLNFAIGKVHTHFWDISQYFAIQGKHTPLFRTAFYVNMRKMEFSVQSMNESFYGNQQLRDYCINDAKITGELGKLVIKIINDMGIVVTTLASPATIVESYIMDQLGVGIPDMTEVPEGALEYGELSIQPPWREFFKRGYFPVMYDYDINSAYPCVIHSLLDLSFGEWKYKKGEPPKNALYGYIKALVNVPDDAYVSWINFGGKLNFSPTGKFYCYLTLNGYRSCNTEAVSGWYFFSDIRYHLFRYLIKRLYKMKQESTGYKRHLVKFMLASIYGKFHQQVGPSRMRNPFYTAEITTDTKLKVYDLAKQDTSSLIGIHTDCVYSMKELDAQLDEGLGSWSLRGTSPMMAIGLNHFEKADGYWCRLFKQYPNEISYGTEHDGKLSPRSLAEALRDGADFGDANVFLPVKDKVDIVHQVHKRRWLSVPKCGNDLMNNIYDSRMFPIHVLGVMNEKGLWSL